MWKPGGLERNSKNTVWALIEFDCKRVDDFCVYDDWGVDVLCAKKKKKFVLLNFMCQKKKEKRKRGTLKERLLASAVALLLWDNCLSFVVYSDVFTFLVMGKKKKKSKSRRKLETRFSRRDLLPVALTVSVFRLSQLPGHPDTFEALDCEFTSKWIYLFCFSR